MSRVSRKEAVERMRAEQARRQRRRRWGVGVVAVVVAAGLAVGITLGVSGGGETSAKGDSGTSTSTSTSPASLALAPLGTLGTLRPAPSAGADGAEGVPVPDAVPLAGLAGAATGQPVDGISCQTSEQTLFHIHAHLTVFVNGVARQVPAAIGIPGAQAEQTPSGPFIASGNCFYWLHTHAADGIIHIESPVQRVYTLGDFFDEWGQPLGPGRVGPATGKVTAIYNGQAYQGNPRNIPLTAHAQIQLEVSTPLIAPTSITWPNGL
jgi:hypothetical protein